MQWSPASANALRSYRALTFPGGRSCQAQCSRRAQSSQRSTAPYALIGARDFQIFAADGVRRNQRRVRTRWVVTGILWKGACPSRPDRYIPALLITVDRAGVGIGPHDGATAQMLVWSFRLVTGGLRSINRLANFRYIGHNNRARTVAHINGGKMRAAVQRQRQEHFGELNTSAWACTGATRKRLLRLRPGGRHA
jgi:hypothetical protein